MDKIDVKLSVSADLDDQTVAEYLQNHPEFFLRNALQVEQMKVPHPVIGAVSLPEWIMNRQRIQLQQLEQDILFIVEQARENQQLFDQLLVLIIELATAGSLSEMLNRLNRWAKYLGLSSASIRLFSDRWNLSAPLDAQDLVLHRPQFDAIRLQRFGEQKTYLGSLNGSELLLLLPNTMHVGSVSISLLGPCGELGVLIFTSRDRQHYQAGMGTVMLEKLAQLLPRLLSKWISRL